MSVESGSGKTERRVIVKPDRSEPAPGTRGAAADAAAAAGLTFASTTISNKVQLSPETLGTEGKVDEPERKAKVRGAEGGGEASQTRTLTLPARERETGRDDNLNDRKVVCRNAPKLAITGWRGVGRGAEGAGRGSRVTYTRNGGAPARTSYSG